MDVTLDQMVPSRVLVSLTWNRVDDGLVLHSEFLDAARGGQKAAVVLEILWALVCYQFPSWKDRFAALLQGNDSSSLSSSIGLTKDYDGGRNLILPSTQTAGVMNLNHGAGFPDAVY